MGSRPDVMALASMLYGLQTAKGRYYGNSWERRGEMGILHNVFRKMDRIENSVNEYAKTGQWPRGQESMTETVADLTVYSLIWLARLAETDRENFYAWLDNVRVAVTLAPIEEKIVEQVNDAYNYIMQQQG